jgi:hypothetical protein
VRVATWTLVRPHASQGGSGCRISVYLDPPFNSNASYNILFAEKDGTGKTDPLVD